MKAQTIFHGSAAQADFQNYLITYELNSLDFETRAIGSIRQDLQSSLGISFYTTINTSVGAISSPHNAYVSSANVNGDTSHKLIGTPFPSGTDDGRVGYEIRFDSPQSIVGMIRNWNTGALTSFYNSSGTLLGTHQNQTVGLEFVGFLADYNDSATWVSKVVLDGASVSGTRQVGYTDDIVWGTAAIAVPEAGTFTLMALGLGLIYFVTARRRAS